MRLFTGIAQIIKARKSIKQFIEKPSLDLWNNVADIVIAPELTVAKAIIQYLPEFLDEFDALKGWKRFPSPKEVEEALSKHVNDVWRKIKDKIKD